MVVRVVLNPEVVKYPLGVTPVFNWILWGYGLSSRLRRRPAFPAPTGDRAVGARDEAAIALLGFVLLTLGVRSVFPMTP